MKSQIRGKTDTIMEIVNGTLLKVTNLDIVNGEIIISDLVTEIREFAFAYCDTLESIIIPNSVNRIWYDAFYNCISLISISIPDSINIIEDYSFSYCYRLKSIIIPNSVTEIGSFSFSHCNSLESIIIPNSIVKISGGAFYHCKKLQSKKGNYKAFEKGLICNDMQYSQNEWNMIEGDIKICEWGLHYVTNLFDIFSFYSGDLEEGIEIWEVEVGDVVVENDDDSKKDTNAILPKHKLTRKEIIDILNNK